MIKFFTPLLLLLCVHLHTALAQDTVTVIPKLESIKKVDNYTIQYLIVLNEKGEMLLQKNKSGWHTLALRSNENQSIKEALDSLANSIGLTIHSLKLAALYTYKFEGLPDHKAVSFRTHYTAKLKTGKLIQSFPSDRELHWVPVKEALEKITFESLKLETSQILKRPETIDGRFFDANNPADSASAFVINETAARELGWKNPVGKRILTHPEEPGRWEGTIVGVVKDINISSLHEKIQPLVMRLPWQKDYPEFFIYVRLEGQAIPIIKAIEEKYSDILPGYTMEYDDVDTFFNSRYQNENKAFGSLVFATLIIVLISSLGIFSLSIYMSARRMKEFGIRKVLGATASQITLLHVGHFIKIACVANVIALPIAYW